MTFTSSLSSCDLLVLLPPLLLPPHHSTHLHILLLQKRMIQGEGSHLDSSYLFSSQISQTLFIQSHFLHTCAPFSFGCQLPSQNEHHSTALLFISSLLFFSCHIAPYFSVQTIVFRSFVLPCQMQESSANSQIYLQNGSEF